jgi:hypothetical protein
MKRSMCSALGVLRLSIPRVARAQATELDYRGTLRDAAGVPITTTTQVRHVRCSSK